VTDEQSSHHQPWRLKRSKIGDHLGVKPVNVNVGGRRLEVCVRTSYCCTNSELVQ